jgi:hypothetical protein
MPDTDRRDRMRRKLGDTAAPYAFTDAELDDLYAQADNCFDCAIRDGFNELLADAAKLSDYTAGASSERRAQVFNNLVRMRDWWAERARNGVASVRYVSLRRGPKRGTPYA